METSTDFMDMMSERLSIAIGSGKIQENSPRQENRYGPTVDLEGMKISYGLDYSLGVMNPHTNQTYSLKWGATAEFHYPPFDEGEEVDNIADGHIIRDLTGFVTLDGQMVFTSYGEESFTAVVAGDYSGIV